MRTVLDENPQINTYLASKRQVKRTHLSRPLLASNLNSVRVKDLKMARFSVFKRSLDQVIEDSNKPETFWRRFWNRINEALYCGSPEMDLWTAIIEGRVRTRD